VNEEPGTPNPNQEHEPGTRNRERGTARITTVFLDAGGVLVNPNWDRVAAALATHGVIISGEELRRVEPEARFAIDTSELSTMSDADRGGLYFRDVLDRTGVPRGAARDAALAEVYAYHQQHNLWETVSEGVTTVLETLRAAGIRLAVASNANGILGTCLTRVGLRSYFDVICDSGLEGVEKPDPRFFEILLHRAGSSPAETIHVGDLYHIDVLGAQRAGIRPLLLDPHNLYGARSVRRIRQLSELVDLVLLP
jgi:putative hydrolase of the HAD superfamily